MPIFGKFLDSPLRKKLIFAWTIHQIARFQVKIFKKILGRGSLSPSPNPSPLNLGLCLRFGLRPQYSVASRSRFGLSLQFTPNMFDNFSQPRGTGWNISAPSISSFLLRHCVLKLITQCRLSVVELSKGEVGGWPKNFISWVYILTKIVGLEGWGGGFNPPSIWTLQIVIYRWAGLGPQYFRQVGAYVGVSDSSLTLWFISTCRPCWINFCKHQGATRMQSSHLAY